MTYQPTDTPHCEKCQRDLEGQASDYVIPGSVNKASFDQCGWCDWEFSASRNKDGSIDIEGA